MKVLFGMLMLFVAKVALSQNLGVIGEVFPVREENFLMFIESRLKTMEETGEIKQLQAHWMEEMTSYATKPKPVGLRRATKSHVHRYVPTLVLQDDVKDEKGDILFSRGTKVNALQALSEYEPHWMFFDADDEEQVAWAKRAIQHLKDVRVILVGGEVSRMERLFEQPIYFDQMGRITRQLGIHRVPAMVSRDKDSLLIREIVIEDSWHAS